MPRRPQINWCFEAIRLGELLPLQRAEPAVLMEAERHGGELWAVALSGGADSLALLLWLWRHWPTQRGQLVALHFNHRLRGRAADRDAEFCRKVCRSLGVHLKIGKWVRPPRAPNEAQSRAARQAYLGKELERLGARVLWLAHQQDDVAETMLMRLARGSSAAGLAAPRPACRLNDGVWRLRPFLTWKKAELEMALAEARLPWQQDETNFTGRFFRNRVRNEVIPLWLAAAQRDVVAGAALTRRLLEEDDTALESWLAEICPWRGKVLLLEKLVGKPRALWRRALRQWLLRICVDTDLSRQGFEQLLSAVEKGREMRLSIGEGFAVTVAGELTWRRQ